MLYVCLRPGRFRPDFQGFHALSLSAIALAASLSLAGCKLALTRQLAQSAPVASGAAAVNGVARIGAQVLSPANPTASLEMAPGVILFVGYDAATGYELWRSNGTASGTFLLKDICPGACSSSPSNLTLSSSGKVFFVANNGTQGDELWVSDGTEAGTFMPVDIAPCGTNSGVNSVSASRWVDLNGVLIFSGFDCDESQGGHDTEPWRSDGTTAGTYMLSDISPVDSGIDFGASFGVLGGYAYFAAGGILPTRTELWRTDGTTAGTTLVMDIYPGGGSSSFPSDFVRIGTTLFFTARDGAGRELWKTDGTTTAMVHDIQPGATGSIAGTLGNPGFGTPGAANLGGTLYFVANDGTNGAELWKSDGTVPGTQLVKDIVAGATGAFTSSGTSFVSLGTTHFFVVDDGTNGRELWKTDGTSAGTDIVANINPGNASSAPAHLTVLGSWLYFVADDGTSGAELWRTDGTTTTQVKDIYPGSSGSGIDALVAFGGDLYFGAEDGVSGRELWRSDGTGAGTVRVKDLFPGGEGSGLKWMNTRVAGGKLVFMAASATGPVFWSSDGTEAGTLPFGDEGARATGSGMSIVAQRSDFILYWGTDSVHGTELWKTDGTQAGTALLKDICPGSCSGKGTQFTQASILDASGTAYFWASTPATGVELWKSDGTEAGTVLVADTRPGPLTPFTAVQPQFTAVGNTVFFTLVANGGTDQELWKTDGTAAGTGRLLDIFPGATGSSILGMAALNGKLIFSAQDTGTNREIWVSDGTTAGTQMLVDLNGSATGSVNPSYSAVAGGLYYFYANDGVNGNEVWKTDGTLAGTAIVKNLDPLGIVALRSLGLGKAWFLVNVGGIFETYVTDGTSAGTVSIGQIQSWASSHTALLPDGRLIFSAWSTGNGAELWVSDGTAPGTQMIKDINPGAGDSLPTYFTTIGDRIVFAANDGTSGSELWSTDGTAAGTSLIADLNPGSASFVMSQPVPLNGRLFFAGKEGTHGVELWSTDGTTAGTALFADILPGTGDSLPLTLYPVGGGLIFQADSGSQGPGVWRLTYNP